MRTIFIVVEPASIPKYAFPVYWDMSLKLTAILFCLDKNSSYSSSLPNKGGKVALLLEFFSFLSESII